MERTDLNLPFMTKTPTVNNNCIKSLKESDDPVVIYSLTEDAEAIANACRDNGISVKAFCDNEIRKSKKPYSGLEVIYTPDLPKRFPKANFVIASHALEDCAEQLSDLGYSNFYSPLELLKNYDVSKHSHRTSQSYMKRKVSHSIKLNELYFDESSIYKTRST